MKNKIIVGMSGGVDSSLAAALLKKKSYDVVGVTIRTWPKEECGASFGRACCNLEAITRARAVAEALKIPYYVVDFSEDFKKEVIDYFCREYQRALTPNPCVMCNEKIKFGKLLEKARSLGASQIATGHYVNTQFDSRRGRFLLKEGRDKRKDQSYFLFSLSQEQLGCAVFPLGKMTKAGVRSMAKKLKLPTYNTQSSQDVCFINDLNYAEFIKKKTGMSFEPGDIVDESGKIMGRHKGIVFYTIGQRRGLGIAFKEPLYVTGIDIAVNRIIVGMKKDLLKKRLIAERLNWISIKRMEKPLRVAARIRYNHKKAGARVTPIDSGLVQVDFDKPQSAPTPGQAVVFYDKDIVIGGGWIKESIE